MARRPVHMNWMWLDDLLPEIAVSNCLVDLVKPGQTCLDVGSHHGHLSVVMSRLVGPGGRVFAFEANRRTAKEAIGVFGRYGCHNIWMTHAAMHERTGVDLPLYGDGHGGDSVVWERAGQVIDRPRSLSLDDFCAVYGVAPDMVKLDIEGAELPALKGATRMLERRPLLIVELSSSDVEIFDFLETRGYDRFVDLNTYRHVRRPADFPDGGVGMIRNALCIPAGHDDLPAAHAAPVATTQVFAGADWSRSGGARVTVPVALDPGRYVARAAPAARRDDAVHYRVLRDGEPLAGYTGPVPVLAAHYPDLPFHVYEAGAVAIEFRPAARRLPRGFDGGGATIEHVEGMAGLARPVLL